MSRIIVKSLPKNVTEDELKKKFNNVGVITDVKVMRTKDGRYVMYLNFRIISITSYRSIARSRQFAFIGFKDESSAEASIKHFNNTYINMTKISVMKAESVRIKR